MLFICVWSIIRLTFKNIHDQFCRNAPLVRFLSNTPAITFICCSLELWGPSEELRKLKDTLENKHSPSPILKEVNPICEVKSMEKTCWFTGLFFTVNGSLNFLKPYTYKEGKTHYTFLPQILVLSRIWPPETLQSSWCQASLILSSLAMREAM